MDKIITVARAASLVGKNPADIHNRIRAGKITPVSWGTRGAGNHTMVKEDDVRAVFGKVEAPKDKYNRLVKDAMDWMNRDAKDEPKKLADVLSDFDEQVRISRGMKALKEELTEMVDGGALSAMPKQEQARKDIGLELLETGKPEFEAAGLWLIRGGK